MTHPAPGGGVHKVTLEARVHADTAAEAERRVLSHFPPVQWPKGSIKVVSAVRLKPKARKRNR